MTSSFFHHFESKEALAVAASDHWSATTGALFAEADYHRHDDPADRILAYLELRDELIDGPIAEYTCLVGTLAQETFDSTPAIREAAWASIHGHAATLEPDLAEALAAAGFLGDVDAEAHSLALFMQAVIQGAFVVSKAAADAEVARDDLGHLRRYVAGRLGRDT